MERGTLSNQRDENGVEPLANMELLRLAVPRRVFTLSQLKYVEDRMACAAVKNDRPPKRAGTVFINGFILCNYVICYSKVKRIILNTMG